MINQDYAPERLSPSGRSAVRLALQACPFCAATDRPDGRYKTLVRRGATHIYRTNKRSVVMGCRDCGLRFTVTFYAIATMLWALAEKQRASGDEKGADYFLNWAFEIPYSDEARGRAAALAKG